MFYPLPLCQLKRWQRVQNVWAGYALGRYAREADCLLLGWLPLIELRSYQLLQCVFIALYFDYWPQYLRLEQYIPTRDLRSSCEVRLKVSINSIVLFETAQQPCSTHYQVICGTVLTFDLLREIRHHIGFYYVNLNYLLLCREITFLTPTTGSRSGLVAQSVEQRGEDNLGIYLALQLT